MIDNPRMTPLTYPWLYATVRPRFASDTALEAALPQPRTPAQLRQLGDDRYLAAMTRRVFHAGVRHEMVDARWPAFEEVFGGFAPEAMAALGPDDLARQMQDARLIRDRAKLQTVARNARFILDVRQEQGGSFGAFIAGWPGEDIVGLWAVLARRGARLGGRSAAGFLRLVGKDTFLLTSDVVARLVAAGVVARAPGGLRDLAAVQQAFNALQQASGRPLCQLSAMLAWSINPVSTQPAP